MLTSALIPCAPSLFAASSTFVSSRPQMTTSAPFSLNCRAISNPIPELPPVTSARTSVSFMRRFYVSLAVLFIQHPRLRGAIEDPTRTGLVHFDQVESRHTWEHLRL